MALTLNGSTGITGAGIGTIGPSGANITGIVTATSISNISSINSGKIGGRRNLVINGAMNVAQRGTSATTDGFGTVDRFQCLYDGTDEAPTQAQHALTSSDTGPWAKGFRNSFHITNGNQTGGASSTDSVGIFYQFEAQDIANSGWEYTSSSSKITLQFWVKSSVAQNFYGYLRSIDGTQRAYDFETGSLSANTWTKVTKTIPGDSSLQFDNNNALGFQVILYPFAGTNLTHSGRALNTWINNDDGTRTPDNTSTWYTTNDATFEITGVQIEVGDTATDFEHRSYGDELALCQRYYYRVKGLSNGDDFGTGFNTNTTNCRPTIPFPVTMRTAVSALEQSGDATDYMVAHTNAETTCSSVPTFSGGSEYNARVVLTVSSGLTAGQGSAGRAVNSDGYLGFSAEL